MSSITPDEVARIARLARLGLSDDELQLFARQLAGILDYAEQLREVETTQVEATSHPLALTAVRREDEVRPPLPRDEALRSAPESDAAAGLFKVPRVIGG